MKYELYETLGRGSWGKVKRAKDVETGQDCAVKIFQRSTLTRKLRGGVDRLYSEYALVQSLAHPNVIAYRDLWEDEQYLYLAMELGGANLEGQLARIQTREEIISLAEQLFAVLAYLHSRGIAHHDVKPSNLLWDGVRLKLIDFGVAERLVNGMASVFWGTPAFQPPEIAGNLDCGPFMGAAADVWSAGVTLYWLLSGGEYPFTGDTVYLLLKAIGEATETPQLDSGWVEMDRLVNACLAINPADRPTASLALQALSLFSNPTGKSQGGCCIVQ